MATASSKEVLKYISDLGISKVQLRVEDIENILDTLIYDGKVEKCEGFVALSSEDGDEASSSPPRLYRAVEPLLPTTGLMRMPCGGCPVIKNCSHVGAVNPKKCLYLNEWLG